MNRIYLAATMGYGLESDNQKELAYYIWFIKEIDDMKRNQSKKVYLVIEVKKE